MGVLYGPFNNSGKVTCKCKCGIGFRSGDALDYVGIVDTVKLDGSPSINQWDVYHHGHGFNRTTGIQVQVPTPTTNSKTKVLLHELTHLYHEDKDAALELYKYLHNLGCRIYT